METPEVAEFRRCILDASWTSAETALMRLGVTEGEGLWVSVMDAAPRCRHLTCHAGGEVPHREAEVLGISRGGKDYCSVGCPA